MLFQLQSWAASYFVHSAFWLAWKVYYAIQVAPYVTDWSLFLAKLLRFGSLIEKFTDIIMLFNKNNNFYAFHCDIFMIWVSQLDGYFNDVVMNNAWNRKLLTILSVKTRFIENHLCGHMASLVSRTCIFIHLYIYYHIFGINLFGIFFGITVKLQWVTSSVAKPCYMFSVNL